MSYAQKALALIVTFAMIATGVLSLVACTAQAESSEEAAAVEQEKEETESSGTSAPERNSRPSVAALTDEEVEALNAFSQDWVSKAQNGELAEGEVSITGPVIVHVDEGVGGVPTNSIDFASSPQVLQKSRYDWYRIPHEKFARAPEECSQIIWVGGRTSVAGTYGDTSIEGTTTVTFLRVIDVQTGTVTTEEITATKSPVQSIDRNTDLSTTKGEYYPYSALDRIKELLGQE